MTLQKTIACKGKQNKGKENEGKENNELFAIRAVRKISFFF
jgi:hypothetical protein